MKSTTERRLLLALLLIAQVPLVTLGVLSAVSVHRMRKEVAEMGAQSRREWARAALLTRTSRAADQVSVFLARRTDDLRTLGLVPPSPASYDRFRRTTLSPVTARDERGDPVRVWLPVYRRVVCFGPDGQVLADAGNGTALADLAGRVPPGLEPGTPWMAPLPGGEAVAFFLRPTADPDRVLAGALDPVHLAAHLSGSPSPPDDPYRNRVVLLFRPDGTSVSFPSTTAGTSVPGAGAALSRVRRAAQDGRSGVLGPEDGGYLAFAPVWLDAGPEGNDRPAGLVYTAAVAAEVEAAGGPPIPELPPSLETRIELLTLASLLGIGLAAWLAARRMARPWVRLRDKARSVAEPVANGDDEVDEIARSLDVMAHRVATSDDRRRASEQRFREFFEMSPDGVAVLDEAGGFRLFNRSLCQVLRRTPEQLRRAALPELLAVPGAWPELVARLRSRGRLHNHELELVRGDGLRFPALLSLRLARDGGRTEVEAVIRDVSELKDAQRKDREKTQTLFKVYGELSQAHKALQQAYADVERQVREKTAELRSAYEALQVADQVKTEFLMQMSHELRTPLNCIIGYSEAMIEGLDGPVSEEQRDSLERIAQSGRRLLRLIEDLLDLSRLEAGRMDFAIEAVQLEDAVDEVLHQARPLVSGRPVRLEKQVAEVLPAVRADPDRLRQVLFNLVGNALKHTTEGTVCVAAAWRDGRVVEVSVSDTGPGIEPEHQARIFEKFVRAPNGARSGAGLGLAICREIVERMGGEIHVESQPGRGAVFRFTVPAADSPGQLPLPWDAR